MVERGVELLVLGVAVIAHVRELDPLGSKSAFLEIGARRRSREVVSRSRFATQADQSLGSLADRLVVGRPGERGVDPQKLAERLDEAPVDDAQAQLLGVAEIQLLHAL